MIDQAKRMRASYESKDHSKNCSWDHKDHEFKKKKTEEINAIVAEAVSKALSDKKKEHEEDINHIDALLNLNLEEDEHLSE